MGEIEDPLGFDHADDLFFGHGLCSAFPRGGLPRATGPGRHRRSQTFREFGEMFDISTIKLGGSVPDLTNKNPAGSTNQRGFSLSFLSESN